MRRIPRTARGRMSRPIRYKLGASQIGRHDNRAVDVVMTQTLLGLVIDRGPQESDCILS